MTVLSFTSSGVNSFTMAETFLFTSESVNEGHPDKLCDQVCFTSMLWGSVVGRETDAIASTLHAVADTADRIYMRISSHICSTAVRH